MPSVPPSLIQKMESGISIELGDCKNHLGFEGRLPDIVLMLEAIKKYQGNCWWAYDRHFRQQAASQPNYKWSNIDYIIWNLVKPEWAAVGIT